MAWGSPNAEQFQRINQSAECAIDTSTQLSINSSVLCISRGIFTNYTFYILLTFPQFLFCAKLKTPKMKCPIQSQYVFIFFCWILETWIDPICRRNQKIFELFKTKKCKFKCYFQNSSMLVNTYTIQFPMVCLTLCNECTYSKTSVMTFSNNFQVPDPAMNVPNFSIPEEVTKIPNNVMV